MSVGSSNSDAALRHRTRPKTSAGAKPAPSADVLEVAPTSPVLASTTAQRSCVLDWQGVGTVKLLCACLLESSVTHRRVSISARMSRYTRECGQTSSWYDKRWSPSTNKQQTAKSSNSGWSRRGTSGNLAEYEGRHNNSGEGRSHDSAKDTEGDATEGRDKNRDDAGTEEDCEMCRHPKVRAPAPTDVTDFETTQSKLWELMGATFFGHATFSHAPSLHSTDHMCSLAQF